MAARFFLDNSFASHCYQVHTKSTAIPKLPLVSYSRIFLPSARLSHTLMRPSKVVLARYCPSSESAIAQTSPALLPSAHLLPRSKDQPTYTLRTAFPHIPSISCSQSKRKVAHPQSSAPRSTVLLRHPLLGQSRP